MTSPGEHEPLEVFDWASEGIGEHHKPAFINRYSSIALVGVLAVSSIAIAGYHHFNGSQNLDKHDPALKHPAPPDEVLKVGSWNVEGNAVGREPHIKALLKKYDLDALALQEVTTDDAEALQHDMPEYGIYYKLADKRQQPSEGGYGNLIITVQKATDTKGKVFDGKNFVQNLTGSVGGLGQDVANANTKLTATRNGFQEKRSAVAVTIKLKRGDKEIPVRIVTGHTTSHRDQKLHDQQLDEMLDYATDSAKDNMPLALGADLNTGNDETAQAASQRKLGTVAMPGTSVTSGKAIDHFVYRQAKILGTPIIIVLKDSDGSDHSPIISKFDPYQE